ncbi:MAG: sodium:solute symporter family protein [Planctomycetota bacterium]
MSDRAQILLVVGAYLALSLGVGWRAARGTSASATGYVAGDRAMGGLLMYFVTGATIFSAFAFLGAPGRAYSTGIAATYVLAFGVIGFLPFYWTGPAAARLGRAHGYLTQGELVAGQLGFRALAPVMAAVSLVAFVPYLALQMRGAGHVLEVLTGGGVSVEVGAAAVYGVVLLYVWHSGVMGVGWTNTLQGMFMMVLAWALGLYLPRAIHGSVGAMFERMDPAFLRMPGLTTNGEPWTWAMYGSTVLVLAVGFSFWPHLFQKAFAARSERVIRRTVVLYPTFQIFLVPILLIGFAGIGYEPGPADRDQILPHLLLQLDLPALLVGLFCAGALAASMSSGDAILHSAASIAVRDGWIVGAGRPLSAEAERTAIRWTLLPVLVVSYVTATTFYEDLVGLLTYAYGPVSQLAPPVLAALFWRGATGPGALAGLVLGSAVTIGLPFCAGYGLDLGVHPGLPGLAVNALAIVVVSRATAAGQGSTRNDPRAPSSRT